ncbi:hypothetical protein VIOR3934_04254 [Vibrio orientalis CIP 102891 = ATCC 33934]|uniref:Uncharacterized protein n=1 Tax=Vibrio orientalis CIP 102891 = ATCC 33934 TaxID=675816 RepID=F9SNQ1_VIBOR|nr:hypothetical protein [Vibrio orientalis]EGU53318.1 hypothetical protein VIOR3934_04254 [Vibrio orientalis CIP 102891 = ATCC 33934]
MSSKFKEFIRLKRGNKKLILQVCTVEWDGPHEPRAKWVTAKTLDSSIELKDLDYEIETLLSNPKFIGFCSKCNDYFPQGTMHSDSYCQGCAERYLGIVH